MGSLNATVFVVDDDAEMRQSFSALIGSMNLPCEAFASGEEFLRVANSERTGCAVVDYRLDGMDGLELHRRLIESGCRLPVILISGYLNVRTAARALEEGAFRVVEKPYSNEEIVDAIRDAVDYDRASRSKRLLRLDFEHRLQSLDARERVTLECILAGQSNKAIEHRLRLSRRTIERIRSSILEKMNSLSFVELSASIGEARASGAFRPHAAMARGSRLPSHARVGAENVPGPAEANRPGLPWSHAEGRVVEQISAALQCLRGLDGGNGLPGELKSPLREAQALLSMALGEIE